VCACIYSPSPEKEHYGTTACSFCKLCIQSSVFLKRNLNEMLVLMKNICYFLYVNNTILHTKEIRGKQILYCLRYFLGTYLEELRKPWKNLITRYFVKNENKSGNNYTTSFGTALFNLVMLSRVSSEIVQNKNCTKFNM
jgi:hypothetical protein